MSTRVAINVPKEIIEKTANVLNIWLEYDVTAENKILISAIPLDSFRAYREFIYILKEIWENCSFIRYRVLFRDSEETVVYTFDSKQDVLHTKESGTGPKNKHNIRKNKETLYKDDYFGAINCFNDLYNRGQQALTISSDEVGTKNLLYYTVYGYEEFVRLFDLSLRKFFEFCVDKEIDVLVITDELTQAVIKETQAAKTVDLKYYITETPLDDIEAAKNKTRIFEWEHIDEYSKILYLDCGVIAHKNVGALFEETLSVHKFYSYNLDQHLNPKLFASVYFGFPEVSDDFVKSIEYAGQSVFNSGQFMFVNTLAMRKHFENIQWFMANWPREYYFEQPFMCVYFASVLMIDVELLSEYITILPVRDSLNASDFIAPPALVNFMSSPVNPGKKLAYITNFLTLNL
jgi:hypothetical protein